MVKARREIEIPQEYMTTTGVFHLQFIGEFFHLVMLCPTQQHLSKLHLTFSSAWLSRSFKVPTEALIFRWRSRISGIIDFEIDFEDEEFYTKRMTWHEKFYRVVAQLRVTTNSRMVRNTELTYSPFLDKHEIKVNGFNFDPG